MKTLRNIFTQRSISRVCVRYKTPDDSIRLDSEEGGINGITDTTRRCLSKLLSACRAAGVAMMVASSAQNAIAQNQPVVQPNIPVVANRIKELGGEVVKYKTPEGKEGSKTVKELYDYDGPDADEIVDSLNGVDAEKLSRYGDALVAVSVSRLVAAKSRLEHSKQEAKRDTILEMNVVEQLIRSAEGSDKVLQNPNTQKWLKYYYADTKVPDILRARIEVLLAVGG